MVTRRWTAAGPLLGAGLAALTGCGDPTPRIGDAKGMVTYQGKPVSGVMTVKALSPDPQVMCISGYVMHGKFTVTEVPVGPVAVAIDTEPCKSDLLLIESNCEYVAIPKKYKDVDASGLRYDFHGRVNTVDIDLPP